MNQGQLKILKKRLDRISKLYSKINLMHQELSQDVYYLETELNDIQENTMEHAVSPIEDVPFIDPNIEHVGVSHLRKMDKKNLRNVEKMLVIHDNHDQLAVLLSYEKYLGIQAKMQALLETIDLLSNSEETQALIKGMQEATSGKSTRLSEIRQKLYDIDDNLNVIVEAYHQLRDGLEDLKQNI